MAKGIRERHSRSCRSSRGGRCDCSPSYEAQLWNPVERKPTRRTFRDGAEARTWLRDAQIALRRGRQILTTALPVPRHLRYLPSFGDSASAGLAAQHDRSHRGLASSNAKRSGPSQHSGSAQLFAQIPCGRRGV
jgi:hypothetical protein